MTCSSLTRAGTPCKNNAMFLQDGQMYCASHSDKDRRQKVTVGPVDHNLWQAAAANNVRNGYLGHVLCAKLSYGGISNSDTSYLRVFPNNKHQERSDGFGCASLSPMRLAVPGQAHSLENYYQGSKKFPQETVDDFFRQRQRMFEDPVPHRHKYSRGMKPECSYYLNKNGLFQSYNYLDARYFYCRYYEVLTQNNPDLMQLRTYRSQGVNLMICGYDARPTLTRENVWESYHQLSTPFGHESVLFCLLTIDDPQQYPWNQYYWAHPELNYP